MDFLSKIKKIKLLLFVVSLSFYSSFAEFADGQQEELWELIEQRVTEKKLDFILRPPTLIETAITLSIVLPLLLCCTCCCQLLNRFSTQQVVDCLLCKCHHQQENSSWD